MSAERFRVVVVLSLIVIAGAVWFQPQPAPARPTTDWSQQNTRPWVPPQTKCGFSTSVANCKPTIPPEFLPEPTLPADYSDWSMND